MKQAVKSALALVAIAALAIGVWLRRQPAPPSLTFHETPGLSAYLNGPPAKPRENTLLRIEAVRHDIMGTVVKAIVYAETEQLGRSALQAAFGRMIALEEAMSLYIPTSEISAINTLPAGVPHKLSPEMAEVIALSLEASRLTDGAFDMTVQPLIALYRETRGSPLPEQLDDVRRRVGWRHAHFDPDQQTLTFALDGMGITLDGIAKGYLVDEAADVLAEHGIRHYLVDAGGDLRMGGGHPDGRPWTLGVQDPREAGDVVVRTLRLHGGAVVTSGNYRRFTIVNSQKRSHILNPATGHPADMDNVVSSVTIIAPRCVYADALATGLSVMGVEAGLELANRLDGVEALLIEVND